MVREGIAEIVNSLDDLNRRLGLGEDVARRSDRRLESLFAGKLPEEKLRIMTEILNLVRNNWGISVEQIASRFDCPFRTVSELVNLLESEGLLKMDLLRRCTI